MSTYAIGDIQGCFEPLERLLKKINYTSNDRIWFAGDLINRGPESLKTLRFIANLPNAISVLGNHDLHLLAVVNNPQLLKSQDTLQEILQADDAENLCHWLRQQPLLHYENDFLLVHAGLAPQWDLSLAQRCANEVTDILRSDRYADFLNHMYGNQPNQWSESLVGFERLRFITNALTRIRFATLSGILDFSEKGDLTLQSPDFLPWFEIPDRKNKDLNIIFGHWAALYNQWDRVTQIKNIYPLDSGCVWGNCLSALRLEDGVRFSVSC